jgi:hypothetical protein
MDSSTPQQTIDRILQLAYQGEALAAWQLAFKATFNPELSSQALFWWTAALASELCRWTTPTKALFPTPWSLRLISTQCADYNRLKECGFWSEAASNIHSLGQTKLALHMLTWAEELSKNERFKKMVRDQKTIMKEEHKAKVRSKRSQGKDPAQ